METLAHQLHRKVPSIYSIKLGQRHQMTKLQPEKENISQGMFLFQLVSGQLKICSITVMVILHCWHDELMRLMSSDTCFTKHQKTIWIQMETKFQSISQTIALHERHILEITVQKKKNTTRGHSYLKIKNENEWELFSRFWLQ